VGKFVYKVFGALAGVLAARAARSVLDKGWNRAKGVEPPRNPAAPGVGWNDAVAWAVASGIAAGLARLLATRGSARVWEKTTGHLPPGVREVGN
jgi:hypothetical protein